MWKIKKDFPYPERHQYKDAENRGEKLMMRILEGRLDSSTLHRENSQTCVCVSVPACACLRACVCVYTHVWVPIRGCLIFPGAAVIGSYKIPNVGTKKQIQVKSKCS